MNRMRASLSHTLSKGRASPKPIIGNTNQTSAQSAMIPISDVARAIHFFIAVSLCLPGDPTSIRPRQKDVDAPILPPPGRRLVGGDRLVGATPVGDQPVGRLKPRAHDAGDRDRALAG